jgi:hypothetical protein
MALWVQHLWVLLGLAHGLFGSGWCIGKHVTMCMSMTLAPPRLDLFAHIQSLLMYL